MGLLTLDDMYAKIAVFTNETITKSGEVYDEDSLVIVNKYKLGINKAYRDIATLKYRPQHSETKVLNADKRFDVTTLTKTFKSIIKVLDSAENEIKWTQYSEILIECPDEAAGDTVTIYYHYLPADLSALADKTVFPNAAIDEEILCYYGAFFYYMLDKRKKDAETYRFLYEEALDGITENKPEFVKMGW